MKLQNPRNFSVQIRNSTSELIVGTGIIISTDWLILTCTHVLKAAGIAPENQNERVVVYFPQFQEVSEKEKYARVIAYSSEDENDLALLKVDSEKSKISLTHVAQMSSASDSAFNRFRTYGYSSYGEYISSYATGEILGAVEISTSLPKTERIQIKSGQINKGMSGAGVLDVERNLVVGVVSEAWNSKKSSKGEDFAYCIDLKVVERPPFGLQLHSYPYPLNEPTYKAPILEKYRRSKLKYVSYSQGEPAELLEWSGREDIIQTLFSDWQELHYKVSGLIGFGGEGKTSIARHWIELIRNNRNDVAKLDGIFWWNFYAIPNFKEFLSQIFSRLNGNEILRGKRISQKSKLHFIAAMLYAQRSIFILDGFEVMQYQGGDSFGLIKDEDLREFIEIIASLGSKSFCLITSRVPILDLVGYSTFNQIDVRALSQTEGISLLKNLGVQGAESKIGSIIESWDGHALTLGLLGSLLVEKYHGQIDETLEKDVDPLENDDQNARVHRILSRYDAYLTEKEKTFLTIMSDNFRVPINVTKLSHVFSKKVKSLQIQLGGISPKSLPRIRELQKILSNLIHYRILRLDSNASLYILHPLIRAHYLTRWAEYLFDKGYGDYWNLVSRCRNANMVIFAVEKSWSMMMAERFVDTVSLMDALITDIWQKEIKIGAISMIRDHAEISLRPTNDIESIENTFEQNMFQEVGGKTPIAIGLIAAFSLIQKEMVVDPNLRPLLILISDGASNVALKDSKFANSLDAYVNRIRRISSKPQEQAEASARLFRKSRIPSIVIDAEHPAFNQGFCKALADEMGGEYFMQTELLKGWYTRSKKRSRKADETVRRKTPEEQRREEVLAKAVKQILEKKPDIF